MALISIFQTFLFSRVCVCVCDMRVCVHTYACDSERAPEEEEDMCCSLSRCTLFPRQSPSQPLRSSLTLQCWSYGHDHAQAFTWVLGCEVKSTCLQSKYS